MSNATYEPILGRIPSGIFILTVRHEDQETGMLASWVQQAGFTPPSVTVAVKQGRYVADWLTARAPLVLNLLAADQKSLLGHFGRGFDLGQPAFEGLAIQRCPRGVPVLEDSVGHLECQVTSHLDSGDHRLFLTEVTGGTLKRDVEPIIHIRKSGANY